MRAVAFEPHMDDCTLFFAYGLLEFRPRVVTVFGNAEYQPEISGLTRRLEQARAFANLGSFEWTPWLFSDCAGASLKLLEAVTASMASVEADVVYAPLFEEGGHEQHNLVSLAVDAAFGDRAPVHYYATYSRGSGRTRTADEVEPQEGWAALKFAAMACYSSQIENPATQSWFQAADCLREWRA